MRDGHWNVRILVVVAVAVAVAAPLRRRGSFGARRSLSREQKVSHRSTYW